MKITRRQLREIIKESILKESLSQNVKDLLDRDYKIVDENTSYPYGRNRGDVRRTTVYARKDGELVPSEDLKLIQDRDEEIRIRGGAMAALGGVYTTTLSSDGYSLIVKYYKHTAG